MVRAQIRIMDTLGLDDENDGILIMLNKQYHLTRPLSAVSNLFL